MSYHIRRVGKDDAPQILAIYAPIVRDTIISFELEPPSLSEMDNRIASLSAVFPYFVITPADNHKQVLGYAYASKYRSRAAYDWICEVTVYVHAEHHRKRLGQRLYHCLHEALISLGFRYTVAVIGLSNPSSVHFHTQFGFELVGTHSPCGVKFGRWLDVSIMQKRLRPLVSGVCAFGCSSPLELAHLVRMTRYLPLLQKTSTMIPQRLTAFSQNIPIND